MCVLLHGGRAVGPGTTRGVTVAVATTAAQRTGRDEDNYVCGIQAVHTENRRWDQTDGRWERLDRRDDHAYCDEARECVSMFVDATNVDNVKSTNVVVDV